MADSPMLTFKNIYTEISGVLTSSYKKLMLFVGINLLFLIVLALGGIGTLWFLPWSAGYYMFHFFFFRWFFNRTPYLFTFKFFDTLYPAVKVLFNIMVVLTLLAYFPYLPLLFGKTSEALKEFVTAFIGDFMGESNAYNILISLILLVVSPVIFYRPLLGWVASVIGRSGSFKNISKHTEGYYRLFLKILFIFYITGGALWVLDSLLSAKGLLLCVGAAPLVILFDLFLAKTYEILFLD